MEDWRKEKEKLVQKYHELNQSIPKGGIVFAGSSLMEMFPIEKMTELPAYNRGVGGYTTKDYLAVLDACVLELEPSKVFINIGTNDLSDKTQSIEMVMQRYDEILSIIEKRLPNVKIYLMAYYPVNPDAATEYMKNVLKVRSNERINNANRAVEALAVKHNQRYIDVNAPLKDELGKLKKEYTIEGMHINEAGYRAIFPKILTYMLE